MPTNAEIGFYLLMLVVAIVAALLMFAHASRDSSIDDMDAWSRNYTKIQRRH